MFTKNSSFNVLYTEDLNSTHEFYKTIGAEIKKLETDKVVVGVGDFDLHIVLSSTEPAEEYKYAANKPDKGGSTIFYVGSENLEDTFNKVKSSNGSIKSEIYNNLWDGQEFLCEDPNGYKFAFYQMI